MHVKAVVAAALLASGLALAVPPVAAQDAQDTSAAPAKPKPDKAKKICRILQPTGSRFGQRYCRTKEEWDRDAEASQQFLRDGQKDGYRRDGEFNTPK